MRILVTGGAGFLGSHLCDRLVEDGHELVVVDNLYTGARANIQHLIGGNSRLRLIERDIVEPLVLDVDRIFNLACPASPIHYQRDPVATIRTSVLGAANVLELARSTGARVLQASTSEVYGDPSVHPQPESYWGHVNPIGPRACYDEGKRAAETLFFDYHRQHHIDIKVVRIFNTYGPRMHAEDGRVVSNFITQALRNEPITIFGDGRQTRSFCYVDDLVRGMLLMMETDANVTGPINLGNPVEFTMLELAELVIRATGSRSILRFMPLPVDDPRQRRPDITAAGESLGWSPTVALDEGIRRTVDYFARTLQLKAPITFHQVAPSGFPGRTSSTTT